MGIATGIVRDGKIVVDELALPEGTQVTIIADDEQPAVKLPPALEHELLEAIDEADRDDAGAGPEFWKA